MTRTNAHEFKLYPSLYSFPVHAHLKAQGFLQSDLSGLALCVLTYSLPRMECINDVATHLSIMKVKLISSAPALGLDCSHDNW